MVKDAIYEGRREVRTFVDLGHGADVLILTAKEVPKGSYYTTMGALLLTAFTFEAYLNHLGEKRFRFWEEVDSIRVMDGVVYRASIGGGRQFLVHIVESSLPAT